MTMAEIYSSQRDACDDGGEELLETYLETGKAKFALVNPLDPECNGTILEFTDGSIYDYDEDATWTRAEVEEYKNDLQRIDDNAELAESLGMDPVTEKIRGLAELAGIPTKREQA